MLIGKRLQATVWHSGTLKRKVFLGEVLIPLDGWRFEDKAFQCFNWYPLCPKVKWSTAEKISLLLLKTFVCMADMEVVFYKISFLCPSAWKTKRRCCGSGVRRTAGRSQGEFVAFLNVCLALCFRQACVVHVFCSSYVVGGVVQVGQWFWKLYFTRCMYVSLRSHSRAQA